LLVGNKADLAQRRVVTVAETESFAKHHHIQYMETSAKMGANIREAFVKVTAAILGRKPGAAIDAGARETPVLVTGTNTQPEEKTCC
jgi:Ras-related protein Rab-8A